MIHYHLASSRHGMDHVANAADADDDDEILMHATSASLLDVSQLLFHVSIYTGRRSS